ncbi:hypothetical protein Hanom_Chr10g00888951 [Helianthus anomalus]
MHSTRTHYSRLPPNNTASSSHSDHYSYPKPTAIHASASSEPCNEPDHASISPMIESHLLRRIMRVLTCQGVRLRTRLRDRRGRGVCEVYH